MKINVEIDAEIVRLATRHAESIGKTLEQLVYEFLKDFTARSDAANEFRRLSRGATGDSRGWKFSHEEIQRKIR